MNSSMFDFAGALRHRRKPASAWPRVSEHVATGAAKSIYWLSHLSRHLRNRIAGIRFPSRTNRPITRHGFWCRPLVVALLLSGCAPTLVGDRTGQGGALCPGEYFTPTILHYAIALAMKAAACDDPSGSTTTPQNDAAQQASAELRADVDAELSTIEPLAVPLAPEAIVVLPTRDQLLHRVKAEAPSGTEDAALVSSVNLLSYYTISWQVLIKKRDIFEHTILVRSIDLDLDIKTEGRYIILADYDEEKIEVDWFLLPPGGGEKKWILSGSPLGIGAEKTSEFLKEIENFVTRHEAGSATTG